MKPIKLELKNFGPFINETVHFDELKEEQLFLISGRTGSGKTILFDAMTYALYGEASTKDRDKNALRSQFADDKDIASVTFTFKINDAIYVAERQLPYRKPGNKTMTDTKFQLHDITANKKLLAAKPAEGRQAVHDIMKVDVNQFRQILILPQGEFKRFLLSSSKEKQPVLRTLFGTVRFKLLEDQLTAETKALEARVHSLEERLYILLEQIKSETKSEGTVRQQFLSYQEEVQRQQQALEAVQADWKEKSELLSAERRTLEEAAQVNDWLQQLKATEEQQRDLIAKQGYIQEVRDKVSQLKVLDYLKEKKEALAKLQDRRAAWDAKQKALTADKISEENLLASLKESQAQLEQDKSSADEKRRFRDHHRHYIVEEEWQELESRIALIDEEIQAHRQKLENIRPVDTGALLNELTTVMEEREALSQQIQDKQLMISQLEREKSDYDKQNEQAMAKETYEKELNELNLIQTEPLIAAIAQMREHLHSGEECPVCLQQVSEVPPLPDPEALAAYRKIEHRKIRLESLIEPLQAYSFHETAELTARIESLQTELSALTLAKDQCDMRYQASAARYQEDLKNEQTYQSHLQRDEKLQHELLTQTQLYDQFRSRTGSLNYRQFEETWHRYDQAIQDYETTEAELNSQVHDKEHDIARLENEVSHLTALLADSETEYEALTLKLKSDLEKNKLTEEALALNVDMSLLDTLQAEIEEYQSAVQAVQFKLDELNGQIAGRTFTDIRPMEEAVRNLEDTVTMLQAEKHTRLIRVKDNEKLLQQIEAGLKEYEAKVLKQQDTLELSRLLSGKNPHNLTLENYVLTYYLEQTLLLANVRLNDMTHHRYQFRRKKEKSLGYSGLDIEIFDRYSNQVRDITTLSGGETFLASLALALGLSDYVTQLSGGISLESVFIDEGFGTLDNETLETAIESLIELERSGKMVGLISHVEMLKSRIPAILHVESSGYISTTRFAVK
ncbi:AAA family ATPase [Macrococcus bovicus]|nr:SMC family ATPase [Macrococcus bovicus]